MVFKLALLIVVVLHTNVLGAEDPRFYDSPHPPDGLTGAVGPHLSSFQEDEKARYEREPQWGIFKRRLVDIFFRCPEHLVSELLERLAKISGNGIRQSVHLQQNSLDQGDERVILRVTMLTSLPELSIINSFDGNVVLPSRARTAVVRSALREGSLRREGLRATLRSAGVRLREVRQRREAEGHQHRLSIIGAELKKNRGDYWFGNPMTGRSVIRGSSQSGCEPALNALPIG